ncbi:S8 family serine peptidase [Kibdelosporangium aridum]|uniref:S8 family serine peptidase n=1 Tax=Kibdelosporangium aridum TaxID=2030 RepID=UPI00055AE510|nr:S8 family serine peptidase [Kibdelosporangium aridum]
MRGTIYTAVLAVLISGFAGLPAAAGPARTPSATPGPAKTVTLITGDKVTVTQRGHSWDARIEPAKRIGAPGGFVKSVGPDGVIVIPSDAVPLVRSGRLDKALFDVTGLIKLGYDDAATPEIPLLVESGPTVAALGEVKRDLPAARMTAVDTPKQRAADVFETAKTHRIWLNGKAYPTLDQSVPQVGAPAAWQAGHTGAGATIAVLDTGYDPEHPDLKGIVKGEKDFSGEGIKDIVGHGTHVASTAAGRGGKYTGVAKGANLLVGKVCEVSGCPFDAILDGMQWAADSGAKVVNMSLGGGPGTGTDPIETAVNRISAEKGTLFVIAAGNYGPRYKVSTPAAADAALAVASVNKQDQASQFSSPGPRTGDFAVKPDIAAPGEAIVAARAKGTLDDVAVDEYYAKLDGTSMATPHVAGAAAILAAQHPDWTGQQIKAALMSTANPVSATIYQQGAGRLDVARAVSQTVTANVGSLSMGFIKWPHSTDKVTKPVTYTNSGSTPVTLALELQDAGVFSTDVKQITVPAQGQATVNVTLDPTAGPVAEYSGRLTARSGDTVVQTAIGATKEPESYSLTAKLTDRNGTELQPSGNGSVVWQRLDATDWDIVGSNQPVRLPVGRYAVFGVVMTPIAGQVDPSVTLLGEPEIDLRKDTAVPLDARQGVRMTVQVDEKEARRAAAVTAIVVSRGDGRSVGYSSDVTDETYAVPTKGNHRHFNYYNRQQLERPLVRLAVSKPETFEPPVSWVPRSPTPIGAKEYNAVDVGHATAEEIAARDLKGKLAVFTLGASDSMQFDARVKALGDAGAAAVLFYFSESIGIGVREKPPVPVVYTTSPDGPRLAKLGNASVTLTGLPAGPYRYELAFPHHGGIPADLTYRPRNNDLATVQANYHSLVDGGIAYIDYMTRSGDLDMGSGLWSTLVPLPLRRNEYYSPVSWQNSFRVAPNRDSGPEHGYLVGERTYRPGERFTTDWNKAVISPGVSVSNELYTGEPHMIRREGDRITAVLPLFSDAARHSGFPRPEEYSFADKGDTVLYADGKEIGRSGVPGDGAFTVPAAPADYRLTSEVTRTSPLWPLSTKVSAEWTFRSGHTAQATPLPLLAVGFDPKLDITNHARANTVLAIPVRVDRQTGATGSAPSLRAVEVSTDDGTTWRNAPVVKVNGSYWTVVQNPASGFVSLRASASDRDGNSVNQTVIRAYRVK